MSAENSTLSKVKDLLEWVLALRITDAERLRYVDDVNNIFSADISGRRPLQVASVLAILFHIIMLILGFPSFGSTDLEVMREVFVIKQLARPAKLAGAEGMPEAAPPKPDPVIPRPKPTVVPIPDPTPKAPEPIRKEELDEVPKILAELSDDLNIGDITAPPGPPSRGGTGRGRLDGSGVGDRAGFGPGTSTGEGIYTVGGGVSNPVVLVQTTPSYTDEAIKAKVQGVVLLQAVIRKNGRADSFKVIRGLGFGLEESAIKEIAGSWRFKPGTMNGRDVDVLATIEVTFNLR